MELEVDNRLTVRLTHLIYILNDLGMNELSKKFRYKECLLFLQWVQVEIKKLKKRQGSDLKSDIVGIIEVEGNVSGVAISVFSELAYKILCDTSGVVVPTKLLQEIKSLELFHHNYLSSQIPDKIKAPEWSEYDTFEDWCSSVIREASEFSSLCLSLLQSEEQFRVSDEKFSPAFELIELGYEGVAPKTDHNICYIDIRGMLGEFGARKLTYDDLLFVEHWREFGWFYSKSWLLVLKAKIITQLSESLRLHMKRYFRRVADSQGFEMYKDEDGLGFIGIYKMLRTSQVERELALEEGRIVSD